MVWPPGDFISRQTNVFVRREKQGSMAISHFGFKQEAGKIHSYKGETRLDCTEFRGQRTRVPAVNDLT
jgi:hypothetical protein